MGGWVVSDFTPCLRVWDAPEGKEHTARYVGGTQLGQRHRAATASVRRRHGAHQQQHDSVGRSVGRGRGCGGSQQCSFGESSQNVGPPIGGGAGPVQCVSI